MPGSVLTNCTSSCFEAGPLPGSRANGGRCCPHSNIPNFNTGAAFVKSGGALGTGESLS